MYFMLTRPTLHVKYKYILTSKGITSQVTKLQKIYIILDFTESFTVLEIHYHRKPIIKINITLILSLSNS